MSWLQLSPEETLERTRSGGGHGTAVDLSSPWDLAFLPDPKAPPLPDRGPHDDPNDDRGLLFIAMAGTHQVWVLDLASIHRGLAEIGLDHDLIAAKPRLQFMNPVEIHNESPVNADER